MEISKDYWNKYLNKTNPDRLASEYNDWINNTVFEQEDEEQLKNDLIAELELLNQMTVKQYTLYRKWREIQAWVGKNENAVQRIKNNIWIPESPEDFLKLEPELVLADGDKEKTNEWMILRTFTHTAINNNNIGRNLRYIVIDKITGRYLGVICVSSDFLDLTSRDNYIGWSREEKISLRMLQNIAIGSTICPTQPLGFSYVGGKLLALLTLSDVIANNWEENYNDILVGLTTTSLYGSFSQYNSLKYWKKLDKSAGSIKYDPSKESVERMKKWAIYNHPLKYWEWFLAQDDKGAPLKTDHKQRFLTFAYDKFGLDKDLAETDHPRGVYFCELYENTRSFLRREIDDVDLGIKRFDNSVGALSELWKTNYAKKRVEKLLNDNRYSTESLFYDDLMFMDKWDEVKEKIQ
jgi:hypothetical protein